MAELDVTTRTLRRLNPWLAWLRENFTIPVAITLIGCIATAGAFLADLTGKVGRLERSVDALSVKIETLPSRDTNLAVLQEKVSDLERQIDANNRKWDRAEEAADIRVVPKRRR